MIQLVCMNQAIYISDFVQKMIMNEIVKAEIIEVALCLGIV